MREDGPLGFLIVHYPGDEVHAEWIEGVLAGEGHDVRVFAHPSDADSPAGLGRAAEGRDRVLVLLPPDDASESSALARAGDVRATLERSGVEVTIVRVRPGGPEDEQDVVDLGALVGSSRKGALLGGLGLLPLAGASPGDAGGGATMSLRGPRMEEVLLGASAPSAADPGDEFTARFVAYTQDEEAAVEDLLRGLGPSAAVHLGVKRCRWQVGTVVTVRLSGKHLTVDDPEQTFAWSGERELLDFDVTVDPDTDASNTILKFDVAVDGIVVAKLRIDLALGGARAGADRALARGEPARTAFASYASEDRDRVLDRVAAVRISAGLDVFLDCLSLHPGEEWKKALQREIPERDLFLLFWSSHAHDSKWVTWEWREALARKEPDQIQLHPLEAVDKAPPPPELAHLHFGDPYMLARSDSRTTRQ